MPCPYIFHKGYFIYLGPILSDRISVAATRRAPTTSTKVNHPPRYSSVAITRWE